MTEPLPRTMRGAVDLSRLAAPAPAPGAPGAAGAPPALVTVLTEQNLQDLAQQSLQVPVLIDLGSDASPNSAEFSTRLEAIVRSYEGRFILARCNVDTQPAIAQAFQVNAVPALLALIGARPAPLFQGAPDDQQIREVLDQVLEIAQQSGITGRVEVGAEPAAEPEPEPLPPLHQEAYDAIERDDFDAAISAYQRAIKENPKDADARAGLAQVELMARTRDADLSAVRKAAADAPEDIAAQLAVADMDILGGQVEDAFERLIDVLRATAGDERDAVRLRLVSLFEVVGIDDARVIAARRAMASALF